MKNLIHLFTIVIAITLMGFSCCKDDDDPVPLTSADLVGDWNFQSLTFNEVVYDTEAELAELDLTYSYIQLSFLNVTTTSLGIFDHRSSTSLPYTKNYILSNNTINFDGDRFVFYVDNWETFDGTILKVKLISTTATNEAPINGIYIMTR